MNSTSNEPELGDQRSEVRAISTRPLYWSTCRELWENRSTYIVPLIVAAVELLGFAVSTNGLAERRRAVLLLDAPKARAGIEVPYDVVAVMMIFTVFIVGVFYCLDALHGERRDRSILFWKIAAGIRSHYAAIEGDRSIGSSAAGYIRDIVSDASCHAALDQCALLIAHGMSPASTWTYFPLFQQCLVMLYGLVAIALWHAPIYGWALLVSGWARRATFLWAVVPFLAIVGFSRRSRSARRISACDAKRTA